MRKGGNRYFRISRPQLRHAATFTFYRVQTAPRSPSNIAHRQGMGGYYVKNCLKACSDGLLATVHSLAHCAGVGLKPEGSRGVSKLKLGVNPPCNAEVKVDAEFQL